MRFLRYLPRFRRARREMATLAAREQWSRSEIEAFQLERLNNVWAHAAEHVPYYARLKQQSSLPDRFSDLEQFTLTMPLLDKQTVREHHSDFLSCRAGRGRWFRTGGSTGEPLRVFWPSDGYLELLRCRYRFYDMWGVDIFDRAAFLWGHGGRFTPGWRGPIERAGQVVLDRLRNRIRLSAYELDSAALRLALERLHRFQPASLYGFSNAMHMLALEADAVRFSCDSLRVATLSCEPVTPTIVAQVERAFGAPAVAEYGASECGAIAFEGPDRKLRVREDVALVETLPREDGQYDIVLTALGNPCFPLLRYRMNDVTPQIVERPASGFSILESVCGRSDDLMYTRKGRCIHPAVLEGVFEKDQNCRRYRVHQRADGSLDVQVEPMDPDASFDLQTVRQKLMIMVEGYEVDIRTTDAIPLTPAGKHRSLTSDMTVSPIASV